MDDMNDRTGETIASMDHAKDVVIVDEYDSGDQYEVQLPDGGIVSLDDDGIGQLQDMDWTDYPIDHNWDDPPWERDDDNPLTPDDSTSDTIGIAQHTHPNTGIDVSLNYECPNCGGRFGSWHRESNGVGDDETYHCPFCMKQRGEFGPEDDTEKIKQIIREAIEEANQNVRQHNGR